MGGMGAGQYAQMGTALSGSLVGGIGGLIEAQNYHRPHLPPATGPELRLRQLAASQLLGGGQELLGGTALYNQLAPILLGQLPGMHYVPGTPGATGAGGGATAASPLPSYAQSLQSYQQQQALAQQRTALRAQLKGAKGHPAHRALKQQLKGLNQQIKSLPTAAQLERQQFSAGAQPGAFDVRQGSPEAMPSFSGGATGTSDSLGSINDLMASLNSGPDYLQQYNQSVGSGGY